MFPYPLTHLTEFASLNKGYLKPHDTIHTVAKAGNHFHGILVEMTFASPTSSTPQADEFVETGTEGWLSVNEVDVPAEDASVTRIAMKSVVKAEGKLEEEKENIIDIPGSKGVPVELQSSFDAIVGKDDGLGLGDPQAALGDVTFIQASLNNNGEVVDLVKLTNADR